jgi:uncharacterized protein (DUF1330 family)
MSAYVIIEATIHDVEAFRAYMAAAPAAIAASGGRFVVRGGETVMLEGNWEPQRIAVLEFEDLLAAQRWYVSEQYRAAIALREGAADLRMIAVAGLAP